MQERAFYRAMQADYAAWRAHERSPVRRRYRQPPPEQLGCEQELERVLKAFILALQSGKRVRMPAQQEREDVTQKIVPLFAQAQALGEQFAARQLSRGLLPKFVGRLLDRAADFIGRSIDWSMPLAENNIDALGDDATPAEIEQAIAETADTVAGTLVPTEIQDIIEQTVLSELKAAQVDEVVVVNEPGACHLCRDEAAKGAQPIDQVKRPPLHHRCRCHIESV